MTQSQEPPWLIIARQSLGVAETPGRETTPVIRRWLLDLRAWWADDETPWCGVAVAEWMKAAGVKPARDWYRARGWLDWGVPLSAPTVGCVLVFDGGPSRPGGGHVALAVGRNRVGALMALGGNQGNRVSIAPFATARVLGCRWPEEHVALLTAGLPTLAANNQPLSTNEA